MINKQYLLVGLGVMGKNHFRVISGMSDISIAGIVDPFFDGDEYQGVRVYRDFDNVSSLVPTLDAAIISSPTHLHYDHAKYFLDSGVNVFVEKPICDDVKLGEDLIDLASKNKLKLFVGHIERYNPGIQSIKNFIDSGLAGNIYTISTRRVGVSPSRDEYLDISKDLLIHDIDVVCYLMNSMPNNVSLIEHTAISEKRGDVATIIMKFGESVSAVAHANWITPFKERTLTIATSIGIIRMDYISQQWSLFSSLTEDEKVSTIEKHFSVQYREPLGAEHEVFLSFIKGSQVYSPIHAINVLRILQDSKL